MYIHTERIQCEGKSMGNYGMAPFPYLKQYWIWGDPHGFPTPGATPSLHPGCDC